MAWHPYNLDQKAHDLVLKYRQIDKDVLNQAYKMRVTVSYGLERFWGEQFRLDNNKQKYWRDTWKTLVEIMALAGVTIPNDAIANGNTQQIQAMATKLWTFDVKQRKVAIAVLTQLCESIVWWTQRYK
jgi:hypothetical protein